MSNRYAPLPNPRTDSVAQNEMDAAFDVDGDDDDDDNDHNSSESQPLNPSQPSHSPGSYDFENVDYDYPPPGSPPPPSSVAVPNNHGNSNGIIPSFSLDSALPGPRRNWFHRGAAALLPSHYVRRLGLSSARPTGVVGAGINNDGVFANVTAKPSPPVQIVDGDDIYLVPEVTRPEAPPSYAYAQADAVPPYWETTVHAPFSSEALGEMIVDALPTGTLFSFLWNMLVSISFQFVGFLLTYLLHTTHAARLGSRAGLGVTLIQYGFALRGKMDGVSSENLETWAAWKAGDPTPSFESAEDANAYYDQLANNTTSVINEEQASAIVRNATTEWLSFFLMTVGWFILLTSLIGFWRVKRWERGIVASQRENAPPPATSTEQPTNSAVLTQFESIFGLHGTSRGDLFRQGFGLGTARADSLEREREYDENEGLELGERDLMIPRDPTDPRAAALERAIANDARLQRDLRSAGLI